MADLKNREFICDYCNGKFVGYKYFGHRTHCPERPKGRGITKNSFKDRKVKKMAKSQRKAKNGRRKRTTQASVEIPLIRAIKSIKGKIRFLTAKTADLRRQTRNNEQQKTALVKALRYLS